MLRITRNLYISASVQQEFTGALLKVDLNKGQCKLNSPRWQVLFHTQIK